jgi:hypoxanthine phosphoribosyltransferase
MTDAERLRAPAFRHADDLWWDVPVSNEREVLTYELFGTATRELAQAVADSGFRPDMVLSIARGGLGLGMGLGYALAVKNLSVINVEFYTGIDQRLDVPIMLPPTPAAIDLSGLKVLIAEARTVVIYEKPQSVIKPDYSWRLTERWIDFPWSVLPPVVDADALAH